jgi:hypothetical protein
MGRGGVAGEFEKTLGIIEDSANRGFVIPAEELVLRLYREFDELDPVIDLEERGVDFGQYKRQMRELLLTAYKNGVEYIKKHFKKAVEESNQEDADLFMMCMLEYGIKMQELEEGVSPYDVVSWYRNPV